MQSLLLTGMKTIWERLVSLSYLKKHTPVYCSPYTAALLRAKIKDAGINRDILDIKLIENNQSWQVNDFQVRNFFMLSLDSPKLFQGWLKPRKA